MILFLGQLFGLVSMIFGQYLEARAAAKVRQEKYIITKEQFQLFTKIALKKLKLEAREDKKLTDSVDDQLDAELKKK